MTWQPLPVVLPLTSTDRSRGAVSASCNAGGRTRQRLRLSIDPTMLEGGCAWWKPGAKVSVMAGSDQDAGHLRIVPAVAGLTISKPIGRSGSPSLQLIGFPNLPPGELHGATSLEFDHGEDWIDVTLPPWLLPPAPAAAVKLEPARKADAPAPVKPGYVGVSATVEDRSLTFARAKR